MDRQELLAQLEQNPRRKVAVLTSFLYLQLQQGKLSPETCCLSARTLADDYHISEVTAHKALEKLYATDLGQAIANRKNSHAEQQSYTIGVSIESLLPREKHFNYLELPFLLERDNAVKRLQRRGHKVTILSLQELDDPNTDLTGLDGLITKAHPSKALAQRLMRENMPVVQVLVGMFEPSHFHTIMPDVTNAILELMDFWGQDKPIMLATTENRVGAERLDTMEFLAGSYGWDMKLIQHLTVPLIPGDLGQLAGYKAGKQLVKNRQHPRILAASDYFAFGLINAFQEASWMPKKDYELVSIDNLEGMGQTPFGKPFISSIDIRLPELFTTAADMLLELLQSPPSPERLLTCRIPAKLILRATT